MRVGVRVTGGLKCGLALETLAGGDAQHAAMPDLAVRLVSGQGERQG